MRRFWRWLTEPVSLIFTLTNGGLRLDAHSPVTLVSQTLLDGGNWWTGRFGYFPLEYVVRMSATRYAWFPFWPAHKLGVLIYQGLWGVLRWLHRHGVIHSKAPIEVQTRLRDLRIGRTK